MEDDWLERLSEQSNDQTITKITAGVKDLNRANIFLDGRFAFSLDIAQVVDLEVKVGQKVDEKRLVELRSASEFGKLYQRTLEWALARPRSESETRDYLRQRKLRRSALNWQREREGKKPLPELQDDTMALVLKRLVEKKYVDDLKFAQYFIENRRLRKGISPRRLKMELEQKGIEDDLIQQVTDLTERTEEEEILKVVRKKRKKYDDTKLIAYLVRQGFDLQKSKDAVERYVPEDDLPGF